MGAFHTRVFDSSILGCNHSEISCMGCWHDKIVDQKIKIEELLSDNKRMAKALKGVIENDKTHYNHHDPRPDGRLPREDGGTIWLTPKEIAKRALPKPPKEGG